MKFDVVIARPFGGHIHSSAFEEMATALSVGLHKLGHSTAVVDGRPRMNVEQRSIILGAHLLRPDQIPKNAIVYNTEQVGNAYSTNEFLEVLKTHEVWDYSSINVQKLNHHFNVPRARYVPFGYVPELERVPAMTIKPIDVLHYGAMNERREKICTMLRARGLNVQQLFGVYGRERDEYLSLSKVVVNVHFYEQGIFEAARVCYCAMNQVAVVSEQSAGGVGLQYAKTVPYGEIVAAVEELVMNDGQRDWIRTCAYQAVTNETNRMERILEPVVADLT